MIKSHITSIAIISAGIALLASCATTKPADMDDAAIEAAPVETAEKIKKEPKPISVQNTSNQQEKKFKDLVNSVELKVTSSPKQTYTKAAFKTPYTVTVTGAEGPVKDFALTVSYPSSRSNDTIIYGTAQIETDANGVATFTPEVPSHAFKDKVTFYPSPISSSSHIVKLAFDAGVTAPFVVKSAYTQWPGGILYVYDINENGKPTTNNFTILQTLRNAGINAGNAPVGDTSYLNKPIESLYKACIDLTMGEIKRSAAFLAMGSIKYAEPPVENDNGATVRLVCELTCVDMKDCKVIYQTKIEESITDKTKWNADQKCRKALAEKAADMMIYGM